MLTRVGITTVLLALFVPTPFFAQSAPQINSLMYPSAAIGTSNCAFGTGFGATQGAGTVTLNGTAVTPTYWMDGEVCFTVPSNGTPGATNVQVMNAVAPSNTMSFTVEGLPSITGFTPGAATAGSQVTINGMNFGAYQGTARYWTPSFNSIVNLSVVSWSDSRIVVTLPSSPFPSRR